MSKKNDEFNYLMEHGHLPPSSGVARHQVQREHYLQTRCVQLFRYRHPELWRMLIAVPNGGQRSKSAGRWLKSEGMTPGVTDLLLLVRRGAYGSLCLETKTECKYSRLRPEQVEWQADSTAHGNKCATYRNEDEFIEITEKYLNLKDNETF